MSQSTAPEPAACPACGKQTLVYTTTHADPAPTYACTAQDCTYTHQISIDTEENRHTPCCSSHGIDMTCTRYRRTHFVEVRPCCAADAELLRAQA